MLSLRANSVCCDFSSLLPAFAILLLCRYLQAGLLVRVLRAHNVSSEDCYQVCGL